MTHTITHRPTSQIERDIQALQFSPPLAMPDLSFLEAKANKLMRMHTLDPSNVSLKADFWQASEDIKQAEQVVRQIAQRNTTLRTLENELAEAQAAQRIEMATRADSRLARAINEYQAAALVCARALRSVITAQRQASLVPGARHNISHLRLDQFHIPSLYPQSWNGTLGQAMQQGLQQFEQEDPSADYPKLVA